MYNKEINFVNTLIRKIDDNSIKLYKLSDKYFNYHDVESNGFYFDYKDKKIIVMRYTFFDRYTENNTYNILFTDEDYRLLYHVTEKDLGYNSSELHKLYKIVERSVTKVDILMDNFTKEYDNDNVNNIENKDI